MRLLLDSNALLWWITGARIDRTARRRIERHRAAVSAVTPWELGHKHALGKIRLPIPFPEAVAIHDFATMDVTFEHAAAASRLPLHHRDPFDRLLVAQAQAEGLTIVTRDEVFDAYDVDVLHC